MYILNFILLFPSTITISAAYLNTISSYSFCSSYNCNKDQRTTTNNKATTKKKNQRENENRLSVTSRMLANVNNTFALIQNYNRLVECKHNILKWYLVNTLYTHRGCKISFGVILLTRDLSNITISQNPIVCFINSSVKDICDRHNFRTKFVDKITGKISCLL